MGTWSKLDGVNRVLRAAGENPVNTLNSTSGDALMAEAILDEVTLEQQAPGLAANTEVVDLTPDNDGFVQIASDVLHVEVLNIPEKFIIVRGSNPARLYNVTDNTFKFTQSSVRVRMVMGLAYEDLPFTQQVAIADEAGRRYQMLTVGDAAADAVLGQLFAQSRMRARADDIRTRNVSIFRSWSSRLPYWGGKRTLRARWRL